MNLMDLYQNEIDSNGFLRKILSPKEQAAAQRHKAWQQANPDKVLANNLRWRERNPEKAKEAQQRSYQKMKSDPKKWDKIRERNREYMRKWRAAQEAAAENKTE